MSGKKARKPSEMDDTAIKERPDIDSALSEIPPLPDLSFVASGGNKIGQGEISSGGLMDSDGVMDSDNVVVSDLPQFSITDLPQFTVPVDNVPAIDFTSAKYQSDSESDSMINSGTMSGELNSDRLPKIPRSPGAVKVAPKKRCTEQISHEFKGWIGITEHEPTLLKNCEICKGQVIQDGVIIRGSICHWHCLSCSLCGEGMRNENSDVIFYKDKLICRRCAQVRPDPPKCSVCRLPIHFSVEEIRVDGIDGPLHADCLSCHICSKAIKHGEEKLVNGVIQCSSCESRGNNRVCHVCNMHIDDEYVYKGHKYYHPEHLFCDMCGKEIRGGMCMLHHNRVICLNDARIYTSKCAFCKGAFKFQAGDKIRWKNKFYHNTCFVCRVCGCDIKPYDCRSVHGRPHCELCFKQRIKDGDCDDSGKCHSKVKHVPEDALKRMRNYEQSGRTIIYPQYGPVQFEEGVEQRPVKEYRLSLVDL